MILEAATLLDRFKGPTVVSTGQSVQISNETITDLRTSVTPIKAPELRPLARLWDMPRMGSYFAEFWEECAQIEIANQTGQVFGIGRAECFVQTPGPILHLALDMEAQSVAEITCAAPEMMQFVRVYRRLWPCSYRKNPDSGASTQMAANCAAIFRT